MNELHSFLLQVYIRLIFRVYCFLIKVCIIIIIKNYYYFYIFKLSQAQKVYFAWSITSLGASKQQQVPKGPKGVLS